VQLRFASYNIHKAVGVDGRRDHDRIITVLREVNADVIALQEADRRFGRRPSVLPKVLLDDTDWRHVPLGAHPSSLGWHGNALLVRRSIDILSFEALHLPTLEPRGAVCAELEMDGRTFRVVGAHLCLSGLRRRDQIRAILSHCEDRGAMPTVLMGDFNQWGLRSGAMREFSEGWQLVEAGRSFPSQRPIASLDRIVATDHWQELESGVHHSALAAVASDHLPIHASLQLPKI
jgi:endonuclease/exonuclease/phosphatase family metal-dependent hydrolase